MVVTTRSIYPFLLSAILSVTLANPAFSQQPIWDVLKEPGEFIVSLAGDKQGNVWVGTEDKGVFRCSPTKQWTQFTTKDGLGDNNGYAICEDRLGRIWVGLLNHGVSVFNGEAWKTYDVLDGPIGERIFDIACSPVDGDVWMATSAGLTRYSEKKDTWTNYTRSSGLPEDQANALAFDKNGNLYVGLQTAGIAVGKAPDFKTFVAIPGPGPDQLPVTPTGRGLPSGLINDLLVSRDGSIHAATCNGLATSKDSGRNWTYVRGRDYVDKTKKRLGGPPANWQEPADAVLASLLPEDYICSLAEDTAGTLYLGSRTKGIFAIDRANGRTQLTKENSGLGDNYVSVVFTFESRLYAGTYGGSLQATTGAKRPDDAEKPPAALPGATRPFPSRILPPSRDELVTVLNELNKLSTDSGKSSSRLLPKKSNNPTAATPTVFTLEDDWRTQGNWIDRYGRFAGVLLAMCGGGSDDSCGYFNAHIGTRSWMGPNHPEKNDSVRRWVHWITTKDPRALQNPTDGGRKQSELDDHKEAYPLALDGPHLYTTLSIPGGRYIMSCYIFNKDGHDGMNRVRDYVVQVKPTPMSTEAYFRLTDIGSEAGAATQFAQQPIGAQARVRQFWGGVYKRFYIDVAGPRAHVTVHVNANHSFNTILSAVFLDPVGNLPGPKGPEIQPALPRISRFATAKIDASADQTHQALRVMDRLLCLRDEKPAWYAANRRRYLLPLVRYFLQKDADGNCVAAEFERSGQLQAPSRNPIGRQAADVPPGKWGGIEPDWAAPPPLHLRQDLAACLNDLQMFDIRDRTYFDPTNYESFSYDQVSRVGKGWTWSRQDYDAFLRARESQYRW